MGYHLTDDESPLGAGYLLDQVELPLDSDARDSLVVEDRILVGFPGDQEWLKSGQCFVRSSVSTSQLAHGSDLFRYASVSELVSANRYPTAFFSNFLRVEVHHRFIQPVLELSLLLIGVPLVISKGRHRLFAAAGACLLLVVLFQVIGIGAHGLGAARLIRPAALAAWIPMFIFLPLSLVTVRWLDE